MEMNDLTEFQRTIWGWAVHNCQFWIEKSFDEPFDKDAAFEGLRQFNETSRAGYIFHIHNGEVDILDKPESMDHMEKTATVKRSDHYLRFIESVVQEWLPDLDTMLCISMDDGPEHHPYLPMFCFQKVEGTTQILIPDIDFLYNDFYTDENHADTKPYDEKLCEAVFVGSTTGATITEENLGNNTVPRLNAANFFLDKDGVTFILPQVVQCASEEIRALVKKLPYCDTQWQSWADQLQYRFLISMDGNGATCSRVALALKSKGVLLKYNSHNKLYYHYFLDPNTHYIPISKHNDVLDIVNSEKKDPGRYRSISENANFFSDSYLGEQEVKFYMAAVLTIYDRIFAR